ncbi:hypothetical protein [Halioxenophilus sp. WMMB6]|uniref:hypothetical protein n=1 Tax=Halioxenophilus sp. WMMB6 TaxID=3073815 RepID=UPI00295EC667|nr:hypothetical protein [Halioxenophilus sp. WMMB6]
MPTAIAKLRQLILETTRQIPQPALLLGLSGLLCGLGLCLLILQSSQDAAIARLADEHARDIAKLGAEESGQALFNNDLLSLQVLLSSLVELEQVDGLTVHDVDNRILAQAGTILDPSEAILQSAAIAQNESVAGYFTVISAKPDTTATRNLWFALFALAMAIVAAVMAWRQLPRLPRQVVSGDDENFEEEAYDDDDDLYPTAEIRHSSVCEEAVGLTLQPERLAAASKQMGADALTEALALVAQQFNAVATLYGAKLLHSGQSLPVLLFDSDSAKQNTFNALCSAQLLLALSYRAANPLGFQARVQACDLERPTLDVERLVNQSQAVGGQFLAVAAPLAELVADRISFRPEQGFWREVEAFDEAYQLLLDNQLQQLERAITGTAKTS